MDLTAIFEPAELSLAELRFLLDHVEEPPHAAVHGGVFPAGVNPTQITKTLTALHEYDQLEKFRGVKWAGFDAIKDSITRFLDWNARCQEIYRITGGAGGQRSILHASQFSWDEQGGAYKYAIGADSAEMIRTEILDNGERRAFAVKLSQATDSVTEDLSSVAPWLSRSRVGALETIKDDVARKVDAKKKHGSFECSICLHAESFDPASRKTELAARARIGAHLKRATRDVNRHRLLYRKVFESPSARA